MDKKRIIVICNSFWPDVSPRSFRATELVREFARQGHDVTVFKPNTSEQQHKFASDNNFNISDIGTFSKAPLMHSNGRLAKLIGRYVNRFAQLLFEYPDIKLYSLVKNAIRKNNTDFDLCISIAVPYPIHWGTAAGLAKNKITKKWIADCGDPFMGDESDSFKHPFYFKYIENWFCRKTDWLTVPTDNSYSGYYKEFWNKIRVIPQGFNFKEVKIANKKHDYGCPTFGYAGGVIPNYREPFDFLNYLCEIEYDFKFVVYTKYPKYFEKYKAKLGNKIVINSIAERLNVLYEFSTFDFVVNFDNKGSKQVASKLIDYYIIQKPILNIPFRSFNANIFNEFMKENYENAFKIKNPDQYKIENVATKFLEIASV
jgi:hypothetical protein